MTLSASAKAFRDAVHDLGPRAKNSRFSPQLRQLALAHLQLARRRNLSDHQAAKQLGICSDTLLRWAQDDPPSFHEITIAHPQIPAPAPLSFTVSGPQGLQLAGLDLDTLVALWRRLSC